MADLSASSTASVSINGVEYKMNTSETVTGLTDAIKRTQTVTTTKANLVTFGAAAGAGQLIALDFFQLKNHDTTNFVTVGFESASDIAYIKVPAGETVKINTKELEAFTDGSAFSAFTNLTAISCKADTASCVVEFLACD